MIINSNLINCLQYPLKALTSIRFYFEVLFKQKGIGLVYLLLISFVLSLPVSYKVNNLIDTFNKIELPNLIAQIPSGYLSKSGQLVCNNKEESFKKIYTRSGILAIIYNVDNQNDKDDILERQNTTSKNIPFVELNSDYLSVASVTGSVTTIKYTDLFVPGTAFNPADASALVSEVLSVAKNIIYIFMGLWIFSLLIFNSLVLSVLSKFVFFQLGKMNTTFANCLRLSSYASTSLGVLLVAGIYANIAVPFTYLMLVPPVYIILFVNSFRRELQSKGIEEFVKEYTPDGTKVRTYDDSNNVVKEESKKDLSEYLDGLSSTSNKNTQNSEDDSHNNDKDSVGSVDEDSKEDLENSPEEDEKKDDNKPQGPGYFAP